jgi:hypothetical protein
MPVSTKPVLATTEEWAASRKPEFRSACLSAPEELRGESLWHPNVWSHDGAWTEWGVLVDVPIER